VPSTPLRFLPYPIPTFPALSVLEALESQPCAFASKVRSPPPSASGATVRKADYLPWPSSMPPPVRIFPILLSLLLVSQFPTNKPFIGLSIESKRSIVSRSSLDRSFYY